jgi:Domain of unknown function (DUF4149)
MQLFTVLLQLTSSYVLLSTGAHALRPATGGLWTSARGQQRMIVNPQGGGIWSHVINTKPSSSSATTALAVAASGGGAVENDKEEWTKKRLHNTAAFRSAALLLALAAAGRASSSTVAAPVVSLLPATMAASIHVLSFATWFGTVAYTTFVAGITMFQNLPRQTFGRLQAKLFPKYFSLCSVAIVLQLVTLKTLSFAAKCQSTKALAVALVMTLLNQFYLEPVSTNNMMERYRLDDTPGGKDTDEYKKLKASFGKWHGLSSLTNLVALCAGVAHGVFVASALV